MNASAAPLPRVLVVGRSGQLAAALRALAPSGVAVTFLGRDECDMREPVSIERAVARERPGLVINASAYTNVEQAERDPEGAFRINGAGVGQLAAACASRGARLLHVSTDYVFDGAATSPYTPEAAPSPLNVYGASKLDGERRIAALAASSGLDALVVRTSWLYSPVGRNFLLTMLNLFRSRGAASVVDDQIGSPTSAASLARALWAAAARPGARGTAHHADAGSASWYEFAVAIADGALARGLLGAAPTVTPIRTDQYPTLARRPPYSVLDGSSSRLAWGLPAIDWRDNLAATLDAIRHD